MRAEDKHVLSHAAEKAVMDWEKKTKSITDESSLKEVSETLGIIESRFCRSEYSIVSAGVEEEGGVRMVLHIHEVSVETDAVLAEALASLDSISFAYYTEPEMEMTLTIPVRWVDFRRRERTMI